VKTEFTVFSTAVLRRHGFVAWWYSCRCYLYTVKIKFSLDKCDESVTSQTTISVNVAFDRIWTLAASMERGTERKDFACISRSRCHTESRPTVCPFCCTNLRQIPTSASGMQVSSPLWAHTASTYGQLMAC